MLTVRERRGARYCERPGCTNPAMGSGYCSTSCYERPNKPRAAKQKPLDRVATPCSSCGEVYDKYPTVQDTRCRACVRLERLARQKAARAWRPA